MDRRRFLKQVGTVSAASLALATLPGNRRLAAAEREQPNDKTAKDAAEPKTWAFWDLWHLDRLTNLELAQGRPQWQPDGTFVDPLMYGHNSWPTVYRDEKSGRWRMLYSISWKPYQLMLAESDDGIRWRPCPQAEVQPPGQKLAPHHLFTLEDGSAGGVYLDPQAGDGLPFKVFAHESGEPVLKRALADPRHRWHKIAAKEGQKRYMHDELTVVSRDGLHWEARHDMNWGLPDWHPEPPIFGFYDAQRRRHAMTVRPGWGDRRVCLQTTADFRDWSGPELLFQPDALDVALIQHYGMPVFRAAGAYVGLLWIFHCSDFGPVRSFNQFQGPIDVQLAYSFDGRHFFRGKREAFIPLNPAGEHGCAGIQSSSLVETDDEIRIYSGAGKVPHGMSRLTKNGRQRELFATTLHTLRKDGFMFLQSQGDWGEFLSKPLTLLDDKLTVNAQAKFGEIRYQLTDLESRPVEGFSFDDCLPLQEADALAQPLAWRTGNLRDVLNKVVRLEVQLRNAQLFAFHGNFHFLDAQDRALLDDGQPIDTTLFDF